jgi:hypothetical protein
MHSFRSNLGARSRAVSAGARLVDLDGADQMLFVGNRQRISEEIASFLTGERKPSPLAGELSGHVFAVRGSARNLQDIPLTAAAPLR